MLLKLTIPHAEFYAPGIPFNTICSKGSSEGFFFLTKFSVLSLFMKLKLLLRQRGSRKGEVFMHILYQAILHVNISIKGLIIVDDSSSLD